jgi:competence protein ComEA
MRKFISLLVFALAALPAVAQDLPDGAGKDTFVRICSGCHGPEAVTGQRMTKDDWAGVVDDMRVRGASGTDEEFDQIVTYLATAFGKAPKKTNVNTATAKDLSTLFGISDSAAQAIVDYRAKNGTFKTVDDVKKVPGVDAAKVDAKKDQLAY